MFYTEEDLLPRQYCCGDSNDETFCDLYVEKRPAGNCENFLPPRVGKYKVTMCCNLEESSEVRTIDCEI